MKFVLLALVVAVVSACGSTTSHAPAGPCPLRTEPMAGSACAIEGTTCEYVLTLACQTDEYVCTAGKWAMMNDADTAVGCVRRPLVDAGEPDAAHDAAIIDAATE